MVAATAPLGIHASQTRPTAPHPADAERGEAPTPPASAPARLIELRGMPRAVRFDRYGDIDVLILNMNDPPSLLRNDGGNKQNWIKIKLVGTKCNRTAIGARVRVVTGTHSQIDEVHSGTSVMSQSDLRLHFGIGKEQVIDAIEVKWPTTQKIERFTKVKPNQILTIREGAGIVDKFVPKKS